ncbi:MAG: hypothetical protein JWO81_3056 [Alphaproteobacteria bacterium]|nr:hypothetical protein [Alphaproteobacteria bacterium]
MTAFFKEPARQEEFDRRGFIIVPLLDHDEVDQVRRQLDDARPVSTSPSACAYEQSFCTSDGDYRRRAHEIVSAAIGDRLMSLLNGYRLVACGVINKSPGKGVLHVHRDPDVLADRRFAAISAWCPVVDVDEANGSLMMLPGSHKLPNIEAASSSRFYAAHEGGVEAALRVRAAHRGRRDSVQPPYFARILAQSEQSRSASASGDSDPFGKPDDSPPHGRGKRRHPLRIGRCGIGSRRSAGV